MPQPIDTNAKITVFASFTRASDNATVLAPIGSATKQENGDIVVELFATPVDGRLILRERR